MAAPGGCGLVLTGRVLAPRLVGARGSGSGYVADDERRLLDAAGGRARTQPPRLLCAWMDRWMGGSVHISASRVPLLPAAQIAAGIPSSEEEEEEETIGPPPSINTFAPLCSQ